jgi:hypothetical protein
MSRSGSISGINFRHAYSYPVNEPYADPSAAAAWHAAKASSTRNGQSNWYTGAELSNSQKKFSFAGNSAPPSAKNSPSDDDDDDDDSESEESDSGKTVTYQPVRNIFQVSCFICLYFLDSLPENVTQPQRPPICHRNINSTSTGYSLNF